MTDRQTDRQRQRQTDRHTDIQTDRQTETQAGRQTDRHRHGHRDRDRKKDRKRDIIIDRFYGSGPAYLSELLHVYTPSRTLRSSSDTRMLEIQQYKRKTHGFRTFSCFGPHIWNSLPQDLRHCSTLSSFKAKLKTFLFSQYFHPN